MRRFPEYLPIEVTFPNLTSLQGLHAPSPGCEWTLTRIARKPDMAPATLPPRTGWFRPSTLPGGAPLLLASSCVSRFTLFLVPCPPQRSHRRARPSHPIPSHPHPSRWLQLLTLGPPSICARDRLRVLTSRESRESVHTGRHAGQRDAYFWAVSACAASRCRPGTGWLGPPNPTDPQGPLPCPLDAECLQPSLTCRMLC